MKNATETGERKYIVELVLSEFILSEPVLPVLSAVEGSLVEGIVGDLSAGRMADLPTILIEIDTSNGFIMATYIHANGQILALHNGPYTAAKYFYMHDRLGSVRQVIDTSGNVKNCYTYQPFGEALESSHEPQATSNYFMFTGQYHLRAHQYEKILNRYWFRENVGV